MNNSLYRTNAYLAERAKPAYSTGDTLQGFGLTNAGRFYTVLAIGNTRGRIHVEEHLTGRKFWTFDTWYRLAD